MARATKIPGGKKAAPSISYHNETRDNMNGVLLSVFVPFDAMGEDREGNYYKVAVKARDAENKLIQDVQGNQLYVMEDGTHTANPFLADGRTVRPGVKTEERQATPKRILKKTVREPKVVFPDGNMRDLRVELKWNNPQTPQEFAATRAAASATRSSNALDNLSLEQLEALLAAKKAKVAAA